MSFVSFGIAVAVSLVVWKLLKIFSYWTKKGVKQRCAYPIFGDTLSLLFRSQSFTEMMYELYNRYPGDRYTGIYQFFTPTLLLRDPELIKQIVVRDFDNFSDHSPIVPKSCDPIWTKNLLNMTGHDWKAMRATLTCTFTSSKLKRMFPLVTQCAENLINFISAKEQDVVTVEMHDLFSRCTSNVMASCAFGFESDALINPTNEFYMASQNAIDCTSFGRMLQYIMFVGAPKLSKFLGLRLFSKCTTSYFTKIIADAIKYRKENNVSRPDLIQLLTDLKLEKELEAGGHTFTDIDVAAQAVMFIVAGYETLAISMSFLAYELATNLEIQDRLRKEIDEAMLTCDGKLTFEVIQDMKYFDMVIAENERKWPAIVVTDRVACKPYTITPENASEKSLHLKQGDVLWIPICAIQRDPKYFPEPDKFIPERFSAENKRNIHQSTYLPFGIGQRSCIGSRFAKMEMKALFCYLLANYEIVVVNKTIIPMKLKPSFALDLKDGFWLGFKSRTKTV